MKEDANLTYIYNMKGIHSIVINLDWVCSVSIYKGDPLELCMSSCVHVWYVHALKKCVWVRVRVH